MLKYIKFMCYIVLSVFLSEPPLLATSNAGHELREDEKPITKAASHHEIEELMNAEQTKALLQSALLPDIEEEVNLSNFISEVIDALYGPLFAEKTHSNSQVNGFIKCLAKKLGEAETTEEKFKATAARLCTHIVIFEKYPELSKITSKLIQLKEATKPGHCIECMKSAIDQIQ